MPARTGDIRMPLAVGEILSDALAVLRRHFRAYALVSLPFVAADLLLRETGSSLFARVRAALGPDPTQLDLGGIAGAASAGIGGLGANVAGFLVVQLLGAAVVALTAQAWARQQPSVADALATTARRGAAAAGTAMLFFVVMIAVLVPALVMGVGVVAASAITGDRTILVVGSMIAFAIAAAAFIAVTLRFGLYLVVVVLEQRAAVGAFVRSGELMAARGEGLLLGPKGRFSLLFLVSIALGAALQALFALPRVIMAGFIGWSVGDAGLPPLTALPLWFGVPFALVEVATNAVVYPFTNILLTLFYFDLRVRYEAVDVTPEERAP